ncbi:MAG: xanthine dehydrogenase family protein subunit M [Chloroflexota bacterium]
MTTLAPFELHRAHSVAEASSFMDDLGDDAVIYSGGTELLLLMKLGFAEYGHLIDIKPIDELDRLEVHDGTLLIGGAVTHRTLERSGIVRAGWPDFVEMERRVANVRVRSQGSLGGNLAFADPHSDPATFLLAADASVTLGRGEEHRTLPLDQFVLGPYETALRPGELLCVIEVPALPAGAAMSHLRFSFHERPAATVSAWLRCHDGRIAEARVAVGSVGVVPVLVPGVADALVGQPVGAIDADALTTVGHTAADASEPVTDSNGSDEYKHALVQTLVGRAVNEAAARAASPRGITT